MANEKKKVIFGCVILGLALYIFLFSTIFKETSLEKINDDTSELVEISGVTNVVEQEEYDFFYEITSKEFEDRSDKKTIHEATTQYIQDIHSQFLVGNHLGVSKPYSFATLKYEMEQENLSRKLKKEKNEVFYGPLQFQLEDYLKYTLNNTKLDIVKALSENADTKLMKEGKKYFEENPELFSTVDEIIYEVEKTDGTQKRSLFRQDMTTMEKVEPELFHHLYNNPEGTEFEFEEEGEKAVGKILLKKFTNPSFDESEKEIIKTYISLSVYDQLISTTGKSNPIKLDIKYSQGS